jgi:hypothetical protein
MKTPWKMSSSASVTSPYRLEFPIQDGSYCTGKPMLPLPIFPGNIPNDAHSTTKFADLFSALEQTGWIY